MTAKLDKYSDYDILCLMDYAFSQMKANEVIKYGEYLSGKGVYVFEAEFKSGVAEYYLGNFAQAKAHFEEAFLFLDKIKRKSHTFRAGTVRPTGNNHVKSERLFEFAKKLANEERYSDALEILNILMETGVNNPEYKQLAGSICIRMNKYDYAKSFFSDAEKSLTILSE